MNRVFKFIKEAVNKTYWPTEHDCEFIGPGLVNYRDIDCGLCRLDKQAIDKMLNTFIGKPVTINHPAVKITPENFASLAHGYVTNVYYDVPSGKYRAKFLATTEEAEKKIKEWGKVSCAYDVNVSTLGPGGTLNSVPYHQQINDGSFTHLAIVEPNKARYESAIIAPKNLVNSGFVVFQNSKGEGFIFTDQPKPEDKTMLKFKFHFPLTIEKVENSTDQDKTFVTIGDKKVSVKQLVAAFNAKAVAQEKVEEVAEDAKMEILNSKGEKIEVSVKDLVEAFNAGDSEEDEDEKKKKKTEKDEEEFKNSLSEDEKCAYDKMDKEAKNSYKNSKMTERKNQINKVNIDGQVEVKNEKGELVMIGVRDLISSFNAHSEAGRNSKTFQLINARGKGVEIPPVVAAGTSSDGTRASGLKNAEGYFRQGKFAKK